MTADPEGGVMSDDGLQPVIWVSCGKCDRAFVLRRSLRFSGEWVWLWCPDCRCRGRTINPVVHDERVVS